MVHNHKPRYTYVLNFMKIYPVVLKIPSSQVFVDFFVNKMTVLNFEKKNVRILWFYILSTRYRNSSEENTLLKKKKKKRKKKSFGNMIPGKSLKKPVYVFLNLLPLQSCDYILTKCVTVLEVNGSREYTTK